MVTMPFMILVNSRVLEYALTLISLLVLIVFLLSISSFYVSHLNSLHFSSILICIQNAGLKCYDQLNDINKSLETEPNDAIRIGSIFLDIEQYDDSLNDFNKSLEIEPNNARR